MLVVCTEHQMTSVHIGFMSTLQDHLQIALSTAFADKHRQSQSQAGIGIFVIHTFVIVQQSATGISDQFLTIQPGRMPISNLTQAVSRLHLRQIFIAHAEDLRGIQFPQTDSAWPAQYLLDLFQPQPAPCRFQARGGWHA